MNFPVTTTNENHEESALPQAEKSIALLREHREEMALWLALEVLQFNPVTHEDPVLADRLSLLQERLEERLRAKA
jgi:hypothetical protein